MGDEGNHLLYSICGWESLQHTRSTPSFCVVHVLENVCTGTVRELAARTFANYGDCDVKVVHTAPSDSGYGCFRRFRGWTCA